MTDINGDGATTATAAQVNQLLTVTGLVKHFPVRKGLLQKQVAAVQAVDGLDFAVRTGETLALWGSRAAARRLPGMLTRLIEPTGGKIVFNGRDITHLSDGAMRPLRRDVQMIFQDPYGSLNPRHTVGAIVGAPYRLQHVKTDNCTKAAVQELLERVGLKPGALPPVCARGNASASPAHLPCAPS